MYECIVRVTCQGRPYPNISRVIKPEVLAKDRGKVKQAERLGKSRSPRLGRLKPSARKLDGEGKLASK